MKSEQLIPLLNLLNVHGLGPQKVRSLVNTFSDIESIFSLPIKKLCRADGIDVKSARAIRKYLDPSFGEREMGRVEKSKVNIVTFWDPEYPFLLKKIYDPPVLLYCKGQPLNREEDAVSVVGTRSTTPYGRSTTKKLVQELAGGGITIVSGMARGIDSVAHREALNSGVKTVAVLGCGVDIIYPSENRKLYQRIINHGTVVSEFPLKSKPDAGNFPQRNRIISGLSHGTVVVEAGNKSGAILTALNAVDQDRDVFAVPGRINDEQSFGCLRLIRNGAIPVESGARVMEHIQSRMFHPRQMKQQKLKLDLTNEEQKLYRLLSHSPLHIDELAKKAKLTVTHTLTTILAMELKGAVVQLGGKQFVRS